MPLDKPYGGIKRKLVLGIDVGTTYSGVSFCILDPGEIPQIRSVIRYAIEENNFRNPKVPTIVYYGKDGTVRAVGGEARLDANRLQALDEGWVLAEWFKLHLRPRELASDDEDLPMLPPSKTVVQILADFMRYLYKCAKEYISQEHPIGRRLLQSQSDVEYVLAHPNGWGGSQQAKMRRAAVFAGLIPDSDDGQSRIHFVTEGEASLHYCLTNGLAGDAVQTGSQLMIVDAGGGTVDLSTYRITSTIPAKAVESTAPDCVMQGSTFVNVRAGQFLRDKLENSRFGNEEYVETMLECFENSTKPTFRDPTKASYIRFGGPRDTDEQRGVKRGTLTLSASDMTTLFRPSVSAIEDAMRRQSSGASGQSTSMVLLVGGFAASPYLRTELQNYANSSGLSLFYPDSGQSQPVKAVAEGALSYHLDDVVSARVAKYAYGSSCFRPYIPSLPSHEARRDKVRRAASGLLSIPDAFTTILPKGTLVSKEEEFAESFVAIGPLSNINVILRDVTRYKGSERSPRWMDEEPEMFDTLCTIRADISHIPTVRKRGLQGDYYEQRTKTIFLFDLTELKAQLSWMENVSSSRHDSPIAPTYNKNFRVRRKGAHS
ncbi:uncharacterized protein LAESUDRAFT_659042 [Laetiporus sulphureus 93-53]|uniref:Actin-like ATPase domain-containing protein n=1 Tax=Laetiporus sulphureus 93-53 TaxID=1314785 RepID=A0A165CYB1_9APHY|nr:uncharacterized protein LAESUDRAFT_659042 [Laetiporus sulphureus 93-53]KZT03735.1 hypothetical protein LAESUDRAFT_659042 [Laetiporus sulphureus 93-53]